MLRFFIKLIFLLLATYVSLLQPAYGVKIVRLELEYGSDTIIATGGFDIPKTNKILDLELYDDVTPISVANFLNYVNNGSYDLTLFNRSVSDFVLQSGGINNISADPDIDPLGPDTFGEVEEFPPILNEPGLSNIRGTIAMARLSGVINSAGSEWFINLDDNLSLDTVDEGFTVFGSVIDNGMETADQIAAFPTLDISFILGPSFAALPIVDADSGGGEVTLVQRNLVMILSATEISRPILRFTPADGDIGIDITGDGASKSIDVLLKNTGNEVMNIAAISAASLSAPFSIQSESCSNTLLDPVTVAPAASCTVTIQFQAATAGMFNDDLVINYTSQTDGDTYSVKYSLSGEGAAKGVPVISTVKTFDVGTSQVNGFSMTKEFKVDNIGEDLLQVLAITGVSDTDFSQTNNCIDNADLIPPGESCTVIVSFLANDFGKKIATLTIESDDPVNAFLDIELSGFGDNDSDGVLSSVEDIAPNGGDGNYDGLADSQQNNVASFNAITGEYLSLVVDDSHVVTNISVASDDQSNDLPAGILFKHGIIEYEVILDSPGAIIEVGLVLPSGDAPSAFYLYGETADNNTPHWYQYPATQILPNVSLTSSIKNLIKLTVQDGGLADKDQEVNGRIHIGPGITSYSFNDNTGGFMNLMFIGIYLMTLMLLSRRYNGIFSNVKMILSR